MHWLRSCEGSVGLALLLALFGASCTQLLDFGDPAETSDASTSDAQGVISDAGPDLYEPNDTPEDSIAIEPGSHLRTIAPEGDHDYWQIVVAATTDVTIEVAILDGADLDLELYSINQLDQPLAWSRGVGERELIERTASASQPLDPGVYLIHVAAFNDVGVGTYRLSVTVAE